MNTLDHALPGRRLCPLCGQPFSPMNRDDWQCYPCWEIHSPDARIALAALQPALAEIDRLHAENLRLRERMAWMLRELNS